MGRGSRVDGASSWELGAEPQEDTVASSWVGGRQDCLFPTASFSWVETS